MPGTMRQPQRRFAATCVLIAVLAGCAVPAPRNGIGGGAAAVAAPAPRFAAGGPDAEEDGAAQGLPVGGRATFFTLPFLGGPPHQLDQVVEAPGRPRARRPSPPG